MPNPAVSKSLTRTVTANQMVDLFRESLELSKERLRDLENRYGTALGEK